MNDVPERGEVLCVTKCQSCFILNLVYVMFDTYEHYLRIKLVIKKVISTLRMIFS